MSCDCPPRLPPGGHLRLFQSGTLFSHSGTDPIAAFALRFELPDLTLLPVATSFLRHIKIVLTFRAEKIIRTMRNAIGHIRFRIKSLDLAPQAMLSSGASPGDDPWMNSPT